MWFIFTRDPRGCDVALRAMWQRHVGPRGAYAAMWRMRDIYIYYNMVYKCSLLLIRRELLPLRFNARYKLDASF